ncbi:DUF3558 domain-containing protein [Gordonia sp. CPCC 205333]|uniref:DUF3558 domain-containing protein n=1 Tax=Gordonia sp. CPCC 205333 TaxID=3140790 RepID=UPI003AF367A7
MRSSVVAVCLSMVMAVLVSGCGDDSGEAEPATEEVPSHTGPFFATCGGVQLDEVASASGFVGLRLAERTTSDCEWVDSGYAGISFNWYRGSPIDRERGGIQLSKDSIEEIEIKGYPGFIAKNSHVCETAIGFGRDFIEWSAARQDGGVNNIPVQKLCQAVRELATLSIERAR